MLCQRALSGTVEPCAGVAHWRYRVVPGRPLVCCATHRTAGISQAVAQDLGVVSETSSTYSVNAAYNPDLNDNYDIEAGDNRRPVNNGPSEAPSQARQLDSTLILHQQDALGQCYSSATVSAMARLMGHHDGKGVSLAAGQASAVATTKTRLLEILKTGSSKPLDEASAALALLCEAAQYDAVVQYGNPLLKAVSAAVPFSPSVVVSGKQPVPHLEQLAADLALSIALAHISLAGGAGSVGTGGDSGQALLTSAAGIGGTGSENAFAMGLEDVYTHLESALQVLERHSVAPPLQQEVAYCLQGVAAVFAEEVLRSTPPPVSRTTSTAPAAFGAGPLHPAAKESSSSTKVSATAAVPAAVATEPSGSSDAVSSVSSASSTAAANAAAARRSKAISMLRSFLWRGARQNHHRHMQHPQHQHPQRGDSHVAAQGATAATATVTPTMASTELSIGAPTATTTAGNGGTAGGWIPELTSDERSELMAPLRGLLAASEHIALYGPVASGQKPYGAVQLSDQELYDLAIAHLAQGVSTGWPQHVLQALSYFERVVQQQQQQQQGLSAAELQQGGGPSSAPAADVSFERSVCEALLGRRSTVVDAADPSPTSTTAPPTGPTSGGAGGTNGVVFAATSPYGETSEEWDDGDELALLRRLEAQLLVSTIGAGAGSSSGALLSTAGVGNPNGAVSFQVNERGGHGLGNDYESSSAPRAVQGLPSLESSAAAAGGDAGAPGGAAVLTSATVALASSSDKKVPFLTSQQKQAHQQQQQQAVASGRTRAKADQHDDVARKYGWAESWLELSVMPCFPETAGGGPVSLARWFSDPRVVLFNKLLAVRRGAEVQMKAAALGSAVAHVSDASRQRLWKLWQAAAQAVTSARGYTAHHHPQQTSTAPVVNASPPEPMAAAAASWSKNGSGGINGGHSEPLTSVLLAQSRAALQDVGPRAVAAASAVAAAAAAVGSAAASSPRAVAAAAGWMVPFNLGRWGPNEKTTPSLLTGGRTAVTAQALPRAVAPMAAMPTESIVSSGAVDASTEATANSRIQQNGDDAFSHDNNDDTPNGGASSHQGRQLQQLVPEGLKTNNVVPFPGGVTGSGSGIMSAPSSAIPAAAPPLADGLVDVGGAAPPAGGDPAAADATEADAATGGALWAPDAQGHLHPRPRMVTRAVQRAAAAAASIKERVVTLPAGWDPAAIDEATSREAIRRVAAVAAQAICLGALAAYVGNRIVSSGALQAAAASSYSAAAAAAAPTVDASTAQVAAAARAVARWLDSAGLGGAAGEALGQWPLMTQGSITGPHVEPDAFRAEAINIESVSRLAEQYGKGAQLDKMAAMALLRGWAAARAAAPALNDPRDRFELLSGLLGGRALKIARAESERNARMGRRMQVQRVDVEIEHLRCRNLAGSGATAPKHGHGHNGNPVGAEATVTAVVVTAGTETSRVSPLPLSYCSRERLTVTFRRISPEMPTAAGQMMGAAAAAAAGQGAVWRLVDVRDAPPTLY